MPPRAFAPKIPLPNDRIAGATDVTLADTSKRRERSPTTIPETQRLVPQVRRAPYPSLDH